MMVYREMDIGTAKPSIKDRERYRYCGLDLVNPNQSFHAGAYLEAVGRQIVNGPENAQSRLIVVGGTGLYCRLLQLGLQHVAGADPEFRLECEKILAAEGPEPLLIQLGKTDPAALAAIKDPQNGRRVIRALEIARAGGRRPDSHADQKPGPFIGLLPARDILIRKIEERTRQMFKDGLLEETCGLLARYENLSSTASAAIGYREAIAVSKGELTVAKAMESINLRTRQYVKRQLTWFRHQANTVWIELRGDENPAEVAGKIEEQEALHGHPNLAF